MHEEKILKKAQFLFLLFLDSGNLLAFGYRLPEKSYAIFRLPPPGNLIIVKAAYCDHC